MSRRLLEEMLADAAEFNQRICGVQVPETPRTLSFERRDKRFEHLSEELDEFVNADSWQGQADALVDLIYVALGGLVEMGVVPGAAFDEVHRANMRKVRGEVAKRPGNAHDAVKPEGWTPPNLERAVASLTPSVVAHLSPAFLHAAAIRRERGRTYNAGRVDLPDYFPLGDASYFQMLWVKLLRARSIMEGSSGSIVDSLVDLLNYASFWLEDVYGRNTRTEEEAAG